MNTKKLLQDGDISKDDEELIFDPYNPKNREITQKRVEYILKKYRISNYYYYKKE